MSSGRARSALTETLMGRVSQHRQAVESQEQPQTVSLDITSSSRGSGEASFEGRTPVEHRNTPFYGSPWPHLLRAGQAGSFPQVSPPSTCLRLSTRVWMVGLLLLAALLRSCCYSYGYITSGDHGRLGRQSCGASKCWHGEISQSWSLHMFDWFQFSACTS